MRRWLEFKDRYCESEYLFPVKHSGGMLRTADFEKNFRKYLKRIGVKKHITPHTLRNNFAKRCLLAGMDIYTLSRLLGHASVEMTEKAYLDITSNDLKMKYTQFSPVEGIFENKRSRVR
jgi:integrase/recombinase XerD